MFIVIVLLVGLFFGYGICGLFLIWLVIDLYCFLFVVYVVIFVYVFFVVGGVVVCLGLLVVVKIRWLDIVVVFKVREL